MKILLLSCSTGEGHNHCALAVKEVLDAAGCVSKEPALGLVREKMVGGLYLPQDETGDVHQFTQRLAKICSASCLAAGESVGSAACSSLPQAASAVRASTAMPRHKHQASSASVAMPKRTAA